jgi:hypothetical protein
MDGAVNVVSATLPFSFSSPSTLARLVAVACFFCLTRAARLAAALGAFFGRSLLFCSSFVSSK